MEKPQKRNCIKDAIKITEAYARGGGKSPPDSVLEDVYNKLLELHKKIEEDS